VFGGRAVLEHHSTTDPDNGHWRQGVDNWEAPVIVTTTVQFFESLHTDRPGRARKLHSLDNAILIVDEAQTLPLDLSPTIHDMMHKLITDYGCTVVLSTASQPLPPRLYNPTTKRLDKWPDAVTEIVPDVHGLEQRLVRVSYDWSRCAEKFSYTKLAGEMASLPAVLIITHRRPDAQRLCREIDRLVGDETTLHLSTLMCAAHRSEVLATVKRQPRCRVVSTQLVEAGVDFSFPVVYKALSGLDSIVQAAGRCNREGGAVLGDVRVFDAETTPPESLRARAEIVRAMLDEGCLGGAVGSKEVATYFKRLEKKVSLRNGFEIMEARRRLDFPAVAAMFRMIAQTGTPVYVPWGKGVELVARLRKEGPSRELLRRLQRYIIVLHEEDYISDDVETLHWCGGGVGEKNCDCPLALSTRAVLERYSYRFGWHLRRDGED
jgi:CRISPR-associated endonuclease/helicase Cas3